MAPDFPDTPRYDPVSTKAFLFDMDGVLVDSEPSWIEVEREYLPHLFGREVFDRMPNFVGAGLYAVLETARSLGAEFDMQKALEVYEQIAREVYSRSPITGGADALIGELRKRGFRIGLVTQSPHTWIEQVVPRLSHDFEVIVSLHEHPELKRKPAPDGYVRAMEALSAGAGNSFVLEDSNTGIAAGKASGAFTIGFRGNLVDGYVQEGADAYADTMADVRRIVAQRS